MNKKLFKISQVAKFLSVTTTTLRYYESEGLLIPAYVNPETKYRYYNVANINTISYILGLRDAGATMMQIKSYFANQSSMDIVLDALIEQHKKLQRKIDFFQEVFSSSKTGNAVKQYTMPAVKYISKHHIAKDVNDAFEQVKDFIATAVTKASLTSSPVTFIEYNSLDFTLTNFPITIGLEVDSAKEGVIVQPSQEVIKTIHHGPYETLAKAYDALFEYAKQHELELKGNVFEYYYESLNLRKNADDYVTEVIMPLK